MTKKKKVLTAGAAFAVAAAALTPVASVDAAQKRVIELAPMTFTGGEVKLPAKVGSSKITWYKSGIDMKKVNTWQTIKGYAGTKKVPTTIKIKIANYVVGFQQSVAPQEVEVDGKLVLPAKLKANFAVGAYFVDVKWEDAKTDKAGDYEVKGTYTRDGKTITVVAKYSVVDADLKIENVSSSVDQAAEVLSVKADVKNLKDGEKVELVVYPGKDTSATPIKETATVKDGKLTVSKKLPAGTHSFQLVSGDVKTAITEFTVEAPMVKEVKAINATEAQITFNKPVLESVAETVANYSFTSVAPAASATLAIEDIQLQADGKTAIVRFTSKVEAPTTAQLEGASYKVTAQNLLTADYKKVADFTGEYKFSDKVAPVLKGAMISGSNLELAFDEEVDFSTAILRVDGQQVDVSSATLVADEAGKYVYEVAVSGNTVAEGSHSVTLVSLKDLAGNEAGTLTSSYVVAKDVIAPTVKAIEAVSSDTFKVKFSEGVQAAPSIKVMKGAIQYTATLQGTNTAASEYTYQVAADTGAGANPLYGTNDSSVVLSVEVSNYKDAVNLVGATYTGTVTLSKDKTAPALLNQALNTINVVGGNTVITVPFTEAIASKVDGNIKVINPDGVELTPSLVTIVNGSKGANTALQVTVAGSPIAGNYQVVFASGAAVDADSNGNAAFTTSVKYDVSQQYVSFDATNGGVSVPSKNVIRVDFNEEVGTSALNPANYKLDNASLPAGTTAVFTSADKDIVELRLPTSFKVVADAPYKFEISKDVKNAAGSMIVADHTASTKANYTTTVTLLDNVAPELKSAVLKNSGVAVTTDANEVELTFSEILPAIAATTANADDFIVKVNGVEKAVSVKAPDVQDNKVVLTFGEAFNASQTVTVQVAGTNLNIVDLGGNTITAGTLLTATK